MKTRKGPVSPVTPAAQYIRMSTEHQRFSPDNQKAAIEAYAKLHGFEVVTSYQDSGKSGLSLKGRPELKRLLSDVLSGSASFKVILVYDVSRWGRFQDADQAAHYEFMCREAGVPVRYCGESFGHDGGGMASIMKHMKRVMAAEYSRDLSIRIARAQRQQARLGFKQGGEAVFGTRRQVVDEAGRPRMILGPGQRKALSTDKILHVPGPRAEIALVRQIFAMYVTEEMPISQICLRLDKRRRTRSHGQAWTYSTIRRLLSNEIYTGVYVFGRVMNNLGDRKHAPPEEWIRSEVMAPIVPGELFRAALDRMKRTAPRSFSNEELIDGLGRLLREQGYLTCAIIRACPYTAIPEVYIRRFGGMENTYRLVGYTKARVWKTLERGAWPSDEEILVGLRRIYVELGYLSRKAVDYDSQFRALPISSRGSAAS